LQWDTGGYLARWYEGYLVRARSTVFGLYLHYGEGSSFWINLGLQALATLWVLQLTLRVLSMAQPFAADGPIVDPDHGAAVASSRLLTDIFAGLAVLSLFILVLHGEKISTLETSSLFVFTAFAAATHSATLGVLLGLCCCGFMARDPCWASGSHSPGCCRAALRSWPAPPCWFRRTSPFRGNGPGRRAATASPSTACCRTALSRNISGITAPRRN
jgi:hypothetical protein